MSEEALQCFIIMPFSESQSHSEQYWTENFESFLKPLITECGDIKVSRSHPLRGNLVKDIITNLVNADMVVANLTDHNPNVLWELGIRHSYNNGTIIIAEDGTKIPFNISTRSTLFYYPTDIHKNEKFRGIFKKAIKDCIRNPDKIDSIVLETLPTPSRGYFAPLISFTLRKVTYRLHKPRVGFDITNGGLIPAHTYVTVRAYLGKEFLDVIRSPPRPYYSGEMKWNINPGQTVYGNFGIKQEWIDNIEKNKQFRLEIQVTVIDIKKKEQELLPVCYTYIKEHNLWSHEPTSMDEIIRFMPR